MPKVGVDKLTKISVSFFEKMGVSAEIALLVSNHIVQNCLYGHDTHGVNLIPRFIKDLEIGKIKPEARTEIIKTTPSIARADGHRGFGAITMTDVMNAAIEMCRESGIAALTVTNLNHVGILWAYAKAATDAGMIGMLWCGSGPQGGWVAPSGGRKRALGTNPIAIGVPAGEMKPLVLDISTSIAAAGKINNLRREGEKVPQGWIIDDKGNPTTDPNDFREMDGRTIGALLPMAAHKGFGLGIAAELLGHVLTGYGPSYKPDYKEGNGIFVVTVDPDKFLSHQTFCAEVDGVLKHIKSIPTCPGVAEVLIPGEIEYNTKEQRERDGIPVDEVLWSNICTLAEKFGVQIPD